MASPHQASESAATVVAPTSPGIPAQARKKAVWPFVLMAVFALPAGIAFYAVFDLAFWYLLRLYLPGIVGLGIAVLIFLGMLIGGITGAIIRANANSKARASTAAGAPASPIGYTSDGQPIYPVVGYTPDGHPVTADRAVGLQTQNSGTNGMAVASLICAFFFPLLAVIFGHVARSQIRKTGDQGDGMALTGLVVGYFWLAASVIAIIAFVAFFVLGVGRVAY